MEKFSHQTGPCGKRRLDRLGAMMKLAEVQGPTASSRRREKRMYFCPLCNAFHLTSQAPREKPEESITEPKSTQDRRKVTAA